MPPCNTCHGYGYVRVIHRGNGVTDYTGPIIPVGPIRWYFADYGVQLCLCPGCQSAAAKRRRAQEVSGYE